MKLKEMIRQKDIIVAMGCHDPLSAMALERVGFKVAYLGGWAVGAQLGVTEPLTTLSEIAGLARSITHVTDVPLIVDAGAGFGNATMIKRCVRSFEEAGVQGIHLEDQVVPKRLDYHQGRHYITSVEEMMLKLECAIKSRKSEDFVIIGRTDAGRNKEEDFNNAIERANLFAEAGIDMIKIFPRTEEEMRSAPGKVKCPVCYVASEGLGRPIPSPQEAQAMGYKLIFYPLTSIISAYRGFRDAYRNIHDTGFSGIVSEETGALSREIMSMISINELASLEHKP
jgi:methylisocitrate lyase